MGGGGSVRAGKGTTGNMAITLSDSFLALSLPGRVCTEHRSHFDIMLVLDLQVSMTIRHKMRSHLSPNTAPCHNRFETSTLFIPRLPARSCWLSVRRRRASVLKLAPGNNTA